MIEKPSGVENIAAAAIAASNVGARASKLHQRSRAPIQPAAAVAARITVASETEGWRFCHRTSRIAPMVALRGIELGAWSNSSNSPNPSPAKLCGRMLAAGSASAKPSASAIAIASGSAPRLRAASPAAMNPPSHNSASNTRNPVQPHASRTAAMSACASQATAGRGSPRWVTANGSVAIGWRAAKISSPSLSCQKMSVSNTGRSSSRNSSSAGTITAVAVRNVARCIVSRAPKLRLRRDLGE